MHQAGIPRNAFGSLFHQAVAAGGRKDPVRQFLSRQSERNQLSALKQLPEVTLDCQAKMAQDKEGNWTATVTLTNPTSTPALMTRINVVGDKDGDQFLPILYEDNYFALLPGEQKEVSAVGKMLIPGEILL